MSGAHRVQEDDRPAPLLEARGLSKIFERRRTALRAGPPAGRRVRAVLEVDLALRHGEAFALVGESGCGKTTLARLLLGLLEPTAGRVWFDGREIGGLPAGRLAELRRECQIVFQDPGGSLDPRMRIRAAVAEPLKIHRMASGAALERRCSELLELVGLADELGSRFPRELSGGQRQRVAIARALATRPRLLVADEPVTALDLSIRAQIVNLLARLQRELSLTLLVIGHDLTLVEQLADRVGVMFAGRLVEVAEAADFYRRPRHPYSAALLSAVPRLDAATRASRSAAPPAVTSSVAATTEGAPVAVPDEASAEVSEGCVYVRRCPIATSLCARQRPPLELLGDRTWVACHHPERLDTGVDRAAPDPARAR